MKLPRALTDVPQWDEPKFENPLAVRTDTDGDGVIDPWDCQPFNPYADGFLGDMYQQAKKFVAPDRPRAVDRRAAVSRAVSSRISSTRGGISSVRGRISKVVRRAPIHVSRRRAAERRAQVVVRAKGGHKRVTTSRLPVRDGRVQPFENYSAGAAAGRRKSVMVKMERSGAKVGVDFGRAADRRADLRAAMKLNPLMAPGRMSGIPTQRTPQRKHRRASDLPEPNLNTSDW